MDMDMDRRSELDRQRSQLDSNLADEMRRPHDASSAALLAAKFVIRELRILAEELRSQEGGS